MRQAGWITMSWCGCLSGQFVQTAVPNRAVLADSLPPGAAVCSLLCQLEHCLSNPLFLSTANSFPALPTVASYGKSFLILQSGAGLLPMGSPGTWQLHVIVLCSCRSQIQGGTKTWANLTDIVPPESGSVPGWTQ